MKRVSWLVAALFIVAAFGMVSAVTASEKAKAMPMAMKGYVVDTKCATDNEATLAEFVKSHSKDCAMAPDCHKSGYNLYSEGKLWKFDKESSDKVYGFLKKSDSKLNVNVEVEHGKGDIIKLVSITNA